MHWIFFAQAFGFLGYVDAHRTPGDASSASDATARVELIPPGAEFVTHPMPVSSANCVAFGTCMSISKFVGETRFPLPGAGDF